METTGNKKQISTRPASILLIAFFMIVAGIAELVTGFSHNFFGIVTSADKVFTWAAVVIGAFYSISGLLILTMKKWAAKLAVGLLVIDVIGRIVFVVEGFYPMDTVKNTLSLIAGTCIVIIIAIYLILKMKTFK